MTDTDVALYELEMSYREIKDKFDVDPYLLASAHPKVNTEMLILSGYWEKGWDCRIDAFIFKLKEDAYTWTDSMRYDDQCNNHSRNFRISGY